MCHLYCTLGYPDIWSNITLRFLVGCFRWDECWSWWTLSKERFPCYSGWVSCSQWKVWIENQDRRLCSRQLWNLIDNFSRTLDKACSLGLPEFWASWSTLQMLDISGLIMARSNFLYSSTFICDVTHRIVVLWLLRSGEGGVWKIGQRWEMCIE